MSNLVNKGNVIPKKEIAKASLSWIAVGVPYFFGWIATYVMGVFVALTKKLVRVDGIPVKPQTDTFRG